MIDKITAIEALEANNYNGLSASVVAECVNVIQALPDNDLWIPVSEKLPEEFVSVLVHIPGESPLPTVREAYWVGDRWCTMHGSYWQCEVTHWKPMPEPPKEG